MARPRRNRPAVDLSVIIVNYNVREFLASALTSLRHALEVIKAEVIVVDNASSDGSVDMLRRRFPKVKVIANAQNLGFARANNQALKIARGRFLLLINPDTVVQEDTVRTMLDFFAAHPEAGLAGCKVLNPDGSFQSACRRSFPTPWVAFTRIVGLSTLLPRTRWFGRYNLTYMSTESTYEVDAVSGSFMMVRREVYRQVGGLDESFFMYGEDLDWCYRIQQAGWKIFYVHDTRIIHYKGESTKRSGIDEIRTFYDAMRLFVRKHYRHSGLIRGILQASIGIATGTAIFVSYLRPLKTALVDLVAVNVSLLAAEYLWRGEVFNYPTFAYPIVYVVPAVVVIAHLYAAGVYTYRKMSISRTAVAVAVGFILITALTALFKQYAFSRMIMGITGILAVLLLPGWRLAARIIGNKVSVGRSSLFGKRTLIIGTDEQARRLVRRLRQRFLDGYEIQGFIGLTSERIGKEIDGIPVLGSTDNIGKVIGEKRVSDVIIAPQTLSYAQILSIISRSRGYPVSFHLVPNTLEVIIGKASVDSLDELPLVQITYNLEKPFHRATKRVFDLVVSSLLLITVYPFVYLMGLRKPRGRSPLVMSLPEVWSGRLSMVGPPEGRHSVPLKNGASPVPLFVGKPGVAGLIQLQGSRRLSDEEVEQYNLYYARNQSVLLDVEVLLKTWLRWLR